MMDKDNGPTYASAHLRGLLTKVNIQKIEEKYSEFAHLLDLDPIVIQGGEDDVYCGYFVGPNLFILQSVTDGSEVVLIREMTNSTLKHFTFEYCQTSQKNHNITKPQLEGTPQKR
jgi:hypothetical protein